MIPKCTRPGSLSQFHPISLCNVLYEIASTVIANRIKVFLPALISQSQTTFISGRLITYNILIAYELHHYMKCHTRGKEVCMSLKLDMSKAYDRVEWLFIEQLLIKFVFSRHLVDLIMTCATTVSYSFIFNGQQHGYFKPGRGIRQGDPLSPYLLIFVTEALSFLLKKAMV